MEFKIPIVIDDKTFEEAVDKCVAKLKQGGDFVLVTRCKDCKYYKTGNPNANYCYHKRYDELSQSASYEPDDFCSYAEQKEIEGEKFQVI